MIFFLLRYCVLVIFSHVVSCGLTTNNTTLKINPKSNIYYLFTIIFNRTFFCSHHILAFFSHIVNCDPTTNNITLKINPKINLNIITDTMLINLAHNYYILIFFSLHIVHAFIPSPIVSIYKIIAEPLEYSRSSGESVCVPSLLLL